MHESARSTSSIAARLADDDLTAAIADATGAVKRAPTDPAARQLLAQLLCLAGELDRADNHFSVAATQDPKSAIGSALLRRLIRAETARNDWYQAGRLPELMGPSASDLRPYVAAAISLRLGEAEQAGQLLAEAEAQRVPRAGRCNDQPFDDFRDLDDTCGGLLEVLTDGGEYRWAALDAIHALRFAVPQRPYHLVWREAELAFIDGAVGRVHMPAIYAGLPPDSDLLRLGRTTDWTDPAVIPVRGKGQRCFLVGEECLGILDIDTIEFA